MSDEMEKLKAENAKLVSQNAELLREDAALKANSPQEPDNPLLEREWDILKYFFDEDQAKLSPTS